jgi:hypothetical protein
MSLSNKLLAQMRATTRSMMRRGPSVARTVMRESIKTASSMHPAAKQNTASNQAGFDPGIDPASDMLADLSRVGRSVNPFNVPPLSTGAAAIGLPGHFIDAPSPTTPAPATTSCTCPAPMPDRPRRCW